MAYQSHCPVSQRFSPIPFTGNASWSNLRAYGFAPETVEAAQQAPRGRCVFRGLRFNIGDHPGVIHEGRDPLTVELPPFHAHWLVVAHTSDVRPLTFNGQGFIHASTGTGHLGEEAACYALLYEDGTEAKALIRRGHEIGQPPGMWGQNCTQALFHGRNQPRRLDLDRKPEMSWGWSQTRIDVRQHADFTHWLWAWENPHPEKTIVGLRLEPRVSGVIFSGLVAGEASQHPLRWRSRRKALLSLPEEVDFEESLDDAGLSIHLQLDMGMVISAKEQLCYPNEDWAATYNNQLPVPAVRRVLVEYTSHADAAFHLPDGTRVPVRQLETSGEEGPLRVVPSAEKRVRIRVVEMGSSKPVAVKLHIHGQHGEYLPPMEHHRDPNPRWFEDYGVDFSHQWIHHCAYIPGETEVKLPLGPVYVEISKGFEVRPIRQTVQISEDTAELTFELDRVLPWSRRGWRSSDTHVHFLSPATGLLEGAGEDVHVVNLLASQWGELFTNVGDFDGKTVYGTPESGGDGEHLLKVGTENRQHVLGHISLVGYKGPMIRPLCAGGTEEAAFGDPVDVLITEWARQCRTQGGLAIIPHMPRPRLESAATFVEEAADALEFCSWSDLYGGLDPYSLSEWYRYLNCGYLVPAVGGTDKMAASTAVGACRSYAKLPDDQPFTYDTWMQAIRRGCTFVTYGPLLEFEVDGHPMGSRLGLGRGGGTVDVTWHVASCTIPMTRVDLMANGEIIDSAPVQPTEGEGHFTVNVERSTWLALLIRGHYADQPEIITAHTTPVMCDVEGSPFFSKADALTILEQIEGALAYVDTIGTRAETATYKRLRQVLTGAHRRLHNRLHEQGIYHEHSPTEHHDAHDHKHK